MEGGYIGKMQTGGGLGHAGYEGQVIGTVINHGKDKYWGKGESNNYHIGLNAGEETLEGSITRLLLRSIATHSKFEPSSFLEEYVHFMTTPGSHNDAFASSHHRHFYGNYAGGLKPADCAESSEKVHDASDAFTFPTAVLVAGITSDGDVAKVQEAAIGVNHLFRKSTTLDHWITLYTELLTNVLLSKKSAKEAAVEAGEKIGFDVVGSVEAANEKAGQIDWTTYLGGDGTDPMAPCPPEKNFPALLHFIYRYSDHGIKKALLASANGGGDNVPRGAALGAILGAEMGVQGIPEELRTGLFNKESIEKEIFAVTGGAAVKSEL
ncbi:hypothetical protein FGO68_gene5372 [Halteria grandinella]|uniref:ADP-ribosylglycohydrolase n=1 Tax=Halteria grandinella TaxID=5974 RepID=A0A8J8NNA8_HALGN|nr:hypothetical protein FGO68_gene5372 [Halteria grandinella]